MSLNKPYNPPFNSYFHNRSVENDLDKLNKVLEYKFWEEYLPLIEKSPFYKPIGVGEKKKGQLKEFVSFGFHDNNGVEYRICYKIDKKQRNIVIWYIGTHENCYEILCRRAGLKPRK